MVKFVNLVTQVARSTSCRAENSYPRPSGHSDVELYVSVANFRGSSWKTSCRLRVTDPFRKDTNFKFGMSYELQVSVGNRKDARRAWFTVSYPNSALGTASWRESIETELIDQDDASSQLMASSGRPCHVTGDEGDFEVPRPSDVFLNCCSVREAPCGQQHSDCMNNNVRSDAPRCALTTNQNTLVENWMESSTFLSVLNIVSRSSPSRNTFGKKKYYDKQPPPHLQDFLGHISLVYEVWLYCHFELLCFSAAPSLDRAIGDVGRINE